MADPNYGTAKNNTIVPEFVRNTIGSIKEGFDGVKNAVVSSTEEMPKARRSPKRHRSWMAASRGGTKSKRSSAAKKSTGARKSTAKRKTSAKKRTS